jgi:hypothetical protein
MVEETPISVRGTVQKSLESDADLPTDDSPPTYEVIPALYIEPTPLATLAAADVYAIPNDQHPLDPDFYATPDSFAALAGSAEDGDVYEVPSLEQQELYDGGFGQLGEYVDL